MERGHVIFYDDILLNSLTSLAKFFFCIFVKLKFFFVLVSALTFSRNGRVIPFNKK